MEPHPLLRYDFNPYSLTGKVLSSSDADTVDECLTYYGTDRDHSHASAFYDHLHGSLVIAEYKVVPKSLRAHSAIRAAGYIAIDENFDEEFVIGFSAGDEYFEMFSSDTYSNALEVLNRMMFSEFYINMLLRQFPSS